MSDLRIALAQINATVGDLKGNVQKIIHCRDNPPRAESPMKPNTRAELAPGDHDIYNGWWCNLWVRTTYY